MKHKKAPAQNTEYPVETADTLLPFLITRVKGKSRNAVKGLLSHRQVQIGAKIITKFDYPLRPGQVVTVLPPEEFRAPRPPFTILYEDDDLVVIDKPAGLLTVATEQEKSNTAYHILTDYVRGQDPDRRIFIVHRLDRDTSGVMLFAKNEKTKRALQDDWDGRVRARGYLAVVEGRPPEQAGQCRSWLLETVTHLVWSAGPDSGGKEAVTNYKVIAENQGFSLLRVDLDTGRKNQIRVQMQELGCPIAGDRQYGGSAAAMGRLGLHACELALIDPRTEQEIRFVAPMPREFRKLFPKEGSTL
ncbi:MAG: RluA family pseudouridine synthase [Pseudoflavonifractor sp.]